MCILLENSKLICQNTIVVYTPSDFAYLLDGPSVGNQGIQGIQGAQGLQGIVNSGITYTQLPVFTTRQIGYFETVTASNIPFNNFLTKLTPVSLTLIFGVYFIEYSGLVSNPQGDVGNLEYGITSIYNAYETNYFSDPLVAQIRISRTTILKVQDEALLYLMLSMYSTSPFDNAVQITNCKITATRIA